jgi:CheY-like chemotaxis protein
MAGERILVIDDNQGHRELMSLTLETLNYWVETVESGEKGLEMINESPPDLVLLDLTMTGMTGFEVCKQLKSRPETRFIPVVLLTTSQTAIDKTQGLEVGADDYLLKGIDGRELDARIQWVLTRYRKGYAGDPLTRLPGTPAAIEEIRDRLTGGKKFGIIYLGIKDFEAYVSKYGYSRGNDLIIRVSSVLRSVLSDFSDGGKEDYAASLGGDTFCVLSSLLNVVGLAEELVKRLNQMLPKVYDQNDRDKGFIEVKDRRGQMYRHEMMTAIAGIVSNEMRQFEFPEEMLRVGKELLAHLKTLKDQRVLKDRRRN